MPQIVNNASLNPNANSNGINWVPGIAGMNAWKMYPNTMDILMDNLNEGIFYIKGTDNVGMTSTARAFSYKEIPLSEVPDPTKPTAQLPDNVVTKDDLDAFKAEILETIKTATANKKQHYNGGNHNERT